jgi:hypothetical protein
MAAGGALPSQLWSFVSQRCDGIGFRDLRYLAGRAFVVTAAGWRSRRATRRRMTGCWRRIPATRGSSSSWRKLGFP